MNYFPSELVKRFIHLLPHNGTALDVGCGNGKNSTFLAALGFQVTALDINTTAIENLSQQSNITAVNEDISNYNLPQSYDVTIAMNVLHFLKQPEIVIKKLIDNTKELIIINVFSNRTPLNERSANVTYFDKKELQELFSGWDIVICNEYHTTEIHNPNGLHSHDCIELVARRIY